MRRHPHYTAGSHRVGLPVASEVGASNYNHCSVAAIEGILVEHILPSEGLLSMVR